MRGIRSRVFVVLAGSTLLASGMTAATLAGSAGASAPVALASSQAATHCTNASACADTTLIEA